MSCRIEISNIELMIAIGCDLPERSSPQLVLASLCLSNYQNFRASKTDKLEDTLDVSSMKHVIREASQNLELHTLERLGQIIEDSLRKNFHHSGLSWELTLAKKNYSWKYVHSWST